VAHHCFWIPRGAYKWQKHAAFWPSHHFLCLGRRRGSPRPPGFLKESQLEGDSRHFLLSHDKNRNDGDRNFERAASLAIWLYATDPEKMSPFLESEDAYARETGHKAGPATRFGPFPFAVDGLLWPRFRPKKKEEKGKKKTRASRNNRPRRNTVAMGTTKNFAPRMVDRVC